MAKINLGDRNPSEIKAGDLAFTIVKRPTEAQFGIPGLETNTYNIKEMVVQSAGIDDPDPEKRKKVVFTFFGERGTVEIDINNHRFDEPGDIVFSPSVILEICDDFNDIEYKRTLAIDKNIALVKKEQEAQVKINEAVRLKLLGSIKKEITKDI